MRYVSFLVQDRSGNILPGIEVSVYLSGTTTLASLYMMDGVTRENNPTRSDVNGYVAFATADGYYDASGTAPDGSPVVRDNIPVFDVAASAASASASAASATSQAVVATQQATIATTQAGIAATYAAAAAIQGEAVYPNAAAGVNTALAVAVTTAGSGGTNGTFSLPIAAPGAGGTQAVGTFTVSGGAITAAALSVAGTNYTGAPIVISNAALASLSSGLTGSSVTLTPGGGVGFGKYFYVLSSSGASTLELYLNSAGTAIDQTFGLVSAIYSLNQEAGFSFGLIDSVGRKVATVDMSGMLQLFKLTIPAGTLVDDNMAATLTQRILSTPAGQWFQALPPETGYAFAIVDSSGRVMFGLPLIGSTLTGKVSSAQWAQSAYGIAASRENTSYGVLQVADGSGNWQIWSIRKSDGQVFQLTSSGNSVDPHLTSDNYVTYYSSAAGQVEQPVEGGTVRPIFSSASVFLFGDSLTAGVGSSTGNDYPSQLARLSGRTVTKDGIGGQNSLMMVARQGGNPALLTVAANQIPTSGPVSVTAMSVQLLSTPADNVSRNMTGTLAGVPGTLSRTASGGPPSTVETYTFTRTNSGSVVACPANTPFIPDEGVAAQGLIQGFWWGRNNPSPASQVESDIAAAVAYLSPRYSRYIVMGVLRTTGEPSGDAGNGDAIIALNAALASTYGNRFLEVDAAPNAGELTWLNTNFAYTPSSGDNTQIAAGFIPDGLRASPGDKHLNDAGYGLIAYRVNNFLIAKRW